MKFIKDICFIIVIILLILYNDTILYGLRQGQGQLRILIDARDIHSVIESHDTPEHTRKKLLEVLSITKFAKDSLGLDPGKNYSKVYDQKGKPMLWVIGASSRYEIKPYNWSFPLIGKVSYKGFFNYSRAVREMIRLRENGYDAGIGTVGGWSTLGFLNDPVLSEMLSRDVGSLAALIFHELTHKRIYLKSSVRFNENLAEFTGNIAALKYLDFRYGVESVEYREYTDKVHDKQIFHDYMIMAAKDLQFVLKENQNQPLHNLDSLKNKELEEIYKGIYRLPLKRKSRYMKMATELFTDKNAYFIDFLQYSSMKGFFQKEFEKSRGNLTQFFINLEALDEKELLPKN